MPTRIGIPSLAPFHNHLPGINSDDTVAHAGRQHRISVAELCHRINQHPVSDLKIALDVRSPSRSRCTLRNDLAHVIAASIKGDRGLKTVAI